MNILELIGLCACIFVGLYLFARLWLYLDSRRHIAEDNEDTLKVGVTYFMPYEDCYQKILENGEVLRFTGLEKYGEYSLIPPKQTQNPVNDVRSRASDR